MKSPLLNYQQRQDFKLDILWSAMARFNLAWFKLWKPITKKVFRPLVDHLSKVGKG